MSLNWPKPNHNHASEYQVSGWPFVTSSATNEINTTPVKIDFPYVTSWVNVTNTENTAAHTVRVGFTENGVSSAPDANYFVLIGGQSTGKIDLKCKRLWFLRHGSNAASISVIAGLTNVEATEFPTLTGSNGFGGVG